MATVKITQLPPISGASADATDVLPLVDVSSNITNKITRQEFFNNIPSATFSGDLTISDKIVHSGDTNTAIRFPAADTVTVETSGAERMRIDSSGNLGLGVTPSAWGVRALEIAGPAFIGSSSPAITLSTNGVFSGSAWSYKTTAAASAYGQNTGAHYWYTAPSGTAGDPITFTQAMTLNSNGQLILGGSTPSGSAKLTVNGAATETTLIGTNGSIEAFFNGGAGTTVSLMGTTGNFPLGFYTNGAERARIDSSGNLLVGTTTAAYSQSGRGVVEINGSSEGLVGFKIGGSVSGYINSTAADFKLVNVQNTPMLFWTNNTERARIDSSGNLLVGTTTAPSSNGKGLAIYDATFPRLTFRNGTTGDGTADGTQIVQDGLQFRIANLEAGNVEIYTAGSERARIDSSGNVGIGTTATLTKLTLGATTSAGTVAATPSIVLTNRDPTNASFVHSGIFAETYRDVAYPHYSAGIWFTRTPQVGNASSSSDIVFGAMNTNETGVLPSERMRLDHTGNLLVGTTSADPITAATNGISLGSDQIIRVSKNSTSTAAFDRRGTDGTVVTFHKAATQVGRIDVTTTATSYVTSSDYRLKEDILPMSGASERLLALKPVNFAWRVNGSRVDGFIAHEVQAIVPEAVTGIKDAVDEDGNPEYQGIDQSKLVPLLTAALQEAMAKIEALEARITALEA